MKVRGSQSSIGLRDLSQGKKLGVTLRQGQRIKLSFSKRSYLLWALFIK